LLCGGVLPEAKRLFVFFGAGITLIPLVILPFFSGQKQINLAFS